MNVAIITRVELEALRAEHGEEYLLEYLTGGTAMNGPLQVPMIAEERRDDDGRADAADDQEAGPPEQRV